MDLLFILKKIVANWLMPLPLLLLLIGLGVIWLWRGQQRRGLLAVSCGWLLLLLLSAPPLADHLLQPYEQAIVVTHSGEGPATAVVVLGCDLQLIVDAPPSSWLPRCAARRLVQGVISWRRQPDALLVLSGYGGAQQMAVADAMAQVAQELGVPAERIKTLSTAQDTSGEAEQVAALVDGPIVLVTSASHMPRALRYFQATGLPVRPEPADHLAAVAVQRHWFDYAPDAVQLVKVQRAWYEAIGLMWQRLGGE